MAKKTPEINATSTADIAFLLLVFFLATTTMNQDYGMFRRLPPYQPENTEPPKIAKRNILQILVNSDNQIQLGDDVVDVSEIKDRTIEFILNPGSREDLSAKKVVDIDFFGNVEVSRGIVSLQNHNGTSYEMYLAVQDQLAAAFSEMRNKVAKGKFGKIFTELTPEQQEAVKDVIPMSISEAEPNKYKK